MFDILGDGALMIMNDRTITVALIKAHQATGITVARVGAQGRCKIALSIAISRS